MVSFWKTETMSFLVHFCISDTQQSAWHILATQENICKWLILPETSGILFYTWENRLSHVVPPRQGPSASATAVTWHLSPSLTWTSFFPGHSPEACPLPLKWILLPHPPMLCSAAGLQTLLGSKTFFESLMPNTLHLSCSASTAWPHYFLVDSSPPVFLCLLTLLHFLLLPDAWKPSPLSLENPSLIKGSAVFSAISRYSTAPTSK